MKKIVISLSVSLIVIFVYGISFSQIRVDSVKGNVVYKFNKQWKKVKKGLTLKEGTKISTGVRSSVVIMIDRNRVKVRQLTMMKIYRNRKSKSSYRTSIGLKYGRINARIKRLKKLKTIFKVATPVATSSVRGTEEEVSYGPKAGMIIRVIAGSIIASSPFGANRVIGGRSVFQQKSDNAKSENLLANVKNASMVKIYADNISDDEKVGLQINGDELLGNSENLGNPTIDFSGPTTPEPDVTPDINTDVDINIQWPGEKK